MAHPVDPEFDSAEKLFRSVSVDHISPSGDVLPTAVDVPRCSFNRERYAPNPLSVLVPSRPSENGVVALVAGDLPGPVPRPPKPPNVFEPLEFYLKDDPTDDNDAHAEVRVRPVGQAGSPNYKIKDKALREKAKEALARKLRIVVNPT